MKEQSTIVLIKKPQGKKRAVRNQGQRSSGEKKKKGRAEGDCSEKAAKIAKSKDLH